MVVHKRTAAESKAIPAELDLGYLGFFLGLRVNELVAGRLASAGFKNVKQSHGYVVQHLIEQDRTITELAHRMEVTQQAASKVVAEMVGLGILESDVTKDRRAKRIRLSERGWRSVRLARQARGRIEARLLTKVGATAYDDAKSVLLECLAALRGLRGIESRRIRAPH
jgi:DNA-binding MarR family transcriptional regulator